MVPKIPPPFAHMWLIMIFFLDLTPYTTGVHVDSDFILRGCLCCKVRNARLSSYLNASLLTISVINSFTCFIIMTH